MKLISLQEVTLSGVATNQDISDLKNVISNFEAFTRKDNNDLRSEMAGLKNETLKFLIVQTISLVGVLIGLFQLSS